MEKRKTKPKNNPNLRLKTGLLMMQILLPFGLYTAMQMDSPLGMGLISIAFVLSMGAMIWVG